MNKNRFTMKDNLTVVTITNLEDWKRWGERWKKATHGFKRVLCFTDEEMEVKDTWVTSYIDEDFSFSKARNHAKSKALTDWILTLDMDETFLIDPTDYETMNKPGVAGIQITVINRLSSGNQANYCRDAVRFFRKNVNYRYYAHETVEDDLQEKGYTIALGRSLILHDGYSDPSKIEKRFRNARLKAKDILSDPINEKHYIDMKRSVNGIG